MVFSLFKAFANSILKNNENTKKLFEIINKKFEEVMNNNIVTEDDYLTFKIYFYFIIIYFIEKKKNGEEDNEFRIWFNVSPLLYVTIFFYYSNLYINY